MNPSARSDSPIDAYLDALFSRLPRTSGSARRLLVETEDHLREAAAEAVQAGADPVEAERAAVRRFGPAELIATEAAPVVPLRRLALDLVGTAAWLAPVGLIAVGLSGLAAAAMARIAGPAYVGGAASSGLSPSTCRHLAQVQPEAVDCARAAVLETSDDAVVLRLLAGVLGLAMLGLLVLWRHRRGHHAPPRVLPTSFAPTVAACLFGLTAIALTVAAAGAATVGGAPVGPGFFLSAGLVAACFAVGYSLRLFQRLRHPHAVT